MNGRGQLETVDLADVTIDDGFWNAPLENAREVALEYQYERLEETGCP